MSYMYLKQATAVVNDYILSLKQYAQGSARQKRALSCHRCLSTAHPPIHPSAAERHTCVLNTAGYMVQTTQALYTRLHVEDSY